MSQQEQAIKFAPRVAEIVVNGHTLDKDKLAEEIKLYSEQNISKAKQRASQALVIRTLLLEKAGVLIDKGIDEETAIEEIIEENVPEVEIEQDACERFYSQNHRLFQSEPLMIVRHILLAVAKDDIPGRSEQKNKAEKLLETIQSSDDILTEFVKQAVHSRCPSKEKGGSLGEITAGQTVPEFERQVFMLEAGLAHIPIETRYGYHLVYVDKKDAGKLIPFELCIDKIRSYLNERRQRQAVSEYLHQLVNNANITGIKLEIEQENIIL